MRPTRPVAAVLAGLCAFAPALVHADPLKPATGMVIHVSPDGDNGRPGTAAEPVKELDKAVALAKPGDTIALAGGTYRGTFGIGVTKVDKPLHIYGGFAPGFASRDPAAFPSVLQPDNESGRKAREAILSFTKSVKGGVTVDGLVFDMGERNSYHATEGKPPGVETGVLLLPPAVQKPQAPTVEKPCLSFTGVNDEGDVVIRNNVFANCANFGLQAGLRGGSVKVVNNVFVANRMAAVEVFGTCAGKQTAKGAEAPRCIDVEVAHNTILFSWTRLKDFMDMGYGVRVMTKAMYDIHHNVIALAALGAVDHTRANPNEWIKLRENRFFGSKQADLFYSPASNQQLRLRVNEFGDLPFAAKDGNVAGPLKLPVEQGYAEGFLAARYTEDADYDPKSEANRMRELFGLNKQGKLKTTITMFGNRYPWKSALKLFGALPDAGAGKPQ